MPLPFEFDFLKPDYVKVLEWRYNLLKKIRSNPGCLDIFKEHYRNNPHDFINHWGSTFDPRNPEIGLPSTIPFLLFDRQEEWCNWIMEKWRNRAPGIVEKSRDMGMSWLSVAMACTISLFNNGISVGFGSRKEEYVDKIGDPKSLFWKARFFMKSLPVEFRGGWMLKTHAPHMRLLFPDTGSSITGESGDGIGRGDRKSIYFVDEAAHLERPQLVDASLSATTNCRIDISSANGMANSFYEKVHGGKIEVFTFHWRQDPRKDEIWYARKCEELDPVTVAQEIDINYAASVEGVVIPSAWVKAAIGACEFLGIEPTGDRTGALDIADEGKDKNAMGAKQGIELFFITDWSGKGSDTLYTTEKAFDLLDEHQLSTFLYDSDGVGAGIRGDIRMINERRVSQGMKFRDITPFRGSGSVIDPDRPAIIGGSERDPRTNKDFFKNRKAQAWWSLRLRFQYTWRAVEAKKNGTMALGFDPDNIISIRRDIPNLIALERELSQPTYDKDTSGRLIIDKAPDGTKSPNLADTVMMLYSPGKRATGLFH